MEWEQIDDRHQRAKVVGGWLVKAFEDVYHPEHMGTCWDWRVAMAFVPDADHLWIIAEEDTPELIPDTKETLDFINKS